MRTLARLVAAAKDRKARLEDARNLYQFLEDLDEEEVNGLLAKCFDQHLKKLSLGCWIKGRIQKAVVLETARIVRGFLTLEP
ncbi:jg25479 [Pararge aegeria aegeria]|uniref:Jg25479 protein n=1 Tax=Pararge aegeria aegeria TaxID=348720 RepID=A0A8S4QX69_9NEOP|nr:jg25479 [Pararge aegeria aegeria]